MGELRLVQFKTVAIKGVRLGALAAVICLALVSQMHGLELHAHNNTAAARNVGTVKSISGQTLVLKSDSGPEVNVSVSDSTKIVRLAPGSTDLKSATPLTMPDLQVGDRMLVRGQGGDNNSIAATSIIVMKQ